MVSFLCLAVAAGAGALIVDPTVPGLAAAAATEMSWAKTRAQRYLADYRSSLTDAKRGNKRPSNDPNVCQECHMKCLVEAETDQSHGSEKRVVQRGRQFSKIRRHPDRIKHPCKR